MQVVPTWDDSLELPTEGLVQEGFFQVVEGDQLLLVEGFEALGSGMVHGAPGFALKHLVN